MVQLSINMAAFKADCEEIRHNLDMRRAFAAADKMRSYVDTFGEVLDFYRGERELLVDQRVKVSPGEIEAKRIDALTAKTVEELQASYRQAAQGFPGSMLGASDKQANYLARLHWNEGERHMMTDRLSSRECAIMIDIAVKKLGR